jgi:hypothetical protein
VTIMTRSDGRINRTLEPKRKAAESWPAWTDDDRWVTSDDVPSPPTELPPRPSRSAEAWKCGFDLGYAHDLSATASSDLSESETRSWWIGRNLGWLRRESHDFDIRRMIPREDDDSTDPLEHVHPCELVEAGYRSSPDPRWGV